MAVIARQLERQYPDSNRDQGAFVGPLADVIVGDIRPTLWLLLGGAALLLVIACINVVSLLLVRTESRRRELSVRLALGASRARIARHFVTEAGVLVAIGAVLALVVADAGMRLMAGLIPADMQRHAAVPRRPRHQRRRRRLRRGGGARRARHLLARPAAGPLGRPTSGPAWPTADAARRATRGAGSARSSSSWSWRRRWCCSPAPVSWVAACIACSTSSSASGRIISPPSASRRPACSSTSRGRRSGWRSTSSGGWPRCPGVTAVGLTSVLPVSFNGNTTWVRFVGRPYNGEHNEVNQRDVSPGYLATLGARLVAGRYFTADDDATRPKVVVINQAMARMYFPNQDPVGQRIGDTSLTPASITEIVGVVGDVREGALNQDIWPAVYLPIAQSPDTDFAVVVRTAQAPAGIVPSLAAAIRQLDGDLGIFGEAVIADRIQTSPAAYLQRSSAWLVGGFAAVALILGVVGLYGVIAYSASQRTREMGVRMALGAGRGAVYRLILREAGGLALVGIVVGLAGAVAAATFMRKLLFDTPPWDVATLVTVAALLGGRGA